MMPNREPDALPLAAADFTSAQIARLERLRADYAVGRGGEWLDERERRRARFVRWLYTHGRLQS